MGRTSNPTNPRRDGALLQGGRHRAPHVAKEGPRQARLRGRLTGPTGHKRDASRVSAEQTSTRAGPLSQTLTCTVSLQARGRGCHRSHARGHSSGVPNALSVCLVGRRTKGHLCREADPSVQSCARPGGSSGSAVAASQGPPCSSRPSELSQSESGPPRPTPGVPGHRAVSMQGWGGEAWGPAAPVQTHQQHRAVAGRFVRSSAPG